MLISFVWGQSSRQEHGTTENYKINIHAHSKIRSNTRKP